MSVSVITKSNPKRFWKAGPISNTEDNFIMQNYLMAFFMLRNLFLLSKGNFLIANFLLFFVNEYIAPKTPSFTQFLKRKSKWLLDPILKILTQFIKWENRTSKYIIFLLRL